MPRLDDYFEQAKLLEIENDFKLGLISQEYYLQLKNDARVRKYYKVFLPVDLDKKIDKKIKLG